VDCREYMYYYLTGQRDSFLKLAIDLRWTPTILSEELTGQEIVMYPSGVYEHWSLAVCHCLFRCLSVSHPVNTIQF
jgi:hypothetical protein